MSSDTELSKAVLSAISKETGWDAVTVLEKIASTQESCCFTNPWDAAAFLLQRAVREEEMYDEDDPDRPTE